jgi:hypothetical protein
MSCEKDENRNFLFRRDKTPTLGGGGASTVHKKAKVPEATALCGYHLLRYLPMIECRSE